VTCHDLLAVRGALGENTDCPASWLGTHLQKQILSGLRRANAVACVSGATLDDARRLLGDRYPGRLTIIPNALNHPYRPLDETEWTRRIAKLPDMPAGSPYLLLVGTNLRRKNRDVAVRALAKVADRWPGLLVCAGEPLDDELRARASRLGVSGRIVDVPRPDNDTLEALYSGARALIFPSRFEGFGWPIIEAHAAGCPVICSDRPPLPEVAGDAAILCGADDVDAFANAILRLEENPPERARLQRLGHANLARFDRAIVVGQLLQLYADLRRAV
jgi:glycosyltransferase involved in cell wall biosynthesis